MSLWIIHRRFEGGIIPYVVAGDCIDGSYPFRLIGGGETWEKAEANFRKNVQEIAHASKTIEVPNE